MDLPEALSFLRRATAHTARSNGVTDDELFAAARLTLRVRELNSAAGGAVLNELVNRGFSYRQIEDHTGIPKSTAQTWATPPPSTE